MTANLMTSANNETAALNLRNSDRLKEILENSLADNSKTAYENDVKKYIEYCRETESVLNSELTLLDYLTKLSETSKESTIRRKKVSIKKAFHIEISSPTAFRTFFAGLKRTLKNDGRKVKQAKAVHKETLSVIVDGLTDSPADTRNKALLLLAYYGAFRSSELVSLRWTDITELDNGLAVHIDGKTGEMTKFIPYGKKHCPVKSLQSWRKINTGSEFVFVKVNKYGNCEKSPLTRQAFNKIVKKYFGDGLDPDANMTETEKKDRITFSTHSFRRGFVTDSFKKGASVTAIMNQTGHKLVQTVVRYCEKDISRDNSVNILVD